MPLPTAYAPSYSDVFLLFTYLLIYLLIYLHLTGDREMVNMEHE